MNIFKNIILYGQMVKLSHTLFALPFAGISFILAYLQSSLEIADLIRIGLLIVICMVSARSAAMGFNRYVDAEIDERNPRTEKERYLPGKFPNFPHFFSSVFPLLYLSFPVSLSISWHSYYPFRLCLFCFFIL